MRERWQDVGQPTPRGDYRKGLQPARVRDDTEQCKLGNEDAATNANQRISVRQPWIIYLWRDKALDDGLAKGQASFELSINIKIAGLCRLLYMCIQ